MLETMVEAASAGGAVARERITRGFAVAIKGDGSPVTEADREAEAAVARVLGAAYPDHGWLGEETGGRGPDDRRFIVDPIDGTRNFVTRHSASGPRSSPSRRPAWSRRASSIQPVTGELHVARRGDGAFLNGARHPRLHRGRARRAGRCCTARSTSCAARGSGTGFFAWWTPRRMQRGFGDFLSFTTVAEGKGEVALTPEREALGPRRAAPPRGGGGRRLHRLRGQAHHLFRPPRSPPTACCTPDRAGPLSRRSRHDAHRRARHSRRHHPPRRDGGQHPPRAGACCDDAASATAPTSRPTRSPPSASSRWRRGRCGITCQKLGEVEVFADAGVADDVLLTYNILGAAKAERLMAANRRIIAAHRVARQRGGGARALRGGGARRPGPPLRGGVRHRHGPHRRADAAGGLRAGADGHAAAAPAVPAAS